MNGIISHVKDFFHDFPAMNVKSGIIFMVLGIVILVAVVLLASKYLRKAPESVDSKKKGKKGSSEGSETYCTNCGDFAKLKRS